MAIMLTTIWTPNNSGSTVQLSQNLIIARDAMRTDGYKAEVLALIPGGGGVPGEMGLAVEYEDADAYVAALTQGVAPSLAKAQETMQYSDSKPERTSTWMELPGLETAYEDLPKGIVQTSYIKVHAGQAEKAKIAAAKSNHKSATKYIKIEVMKCDLGETSVMEGNLNCSSVTGVNIAKAAVAALTEFKNPYKPNEKAVVNYEQAIQTAFREVSDELAARETLDAQLKAQRRLVAAAQKVYDVSQARYKSGIDSFLSVLDSQRELYTFQQQEIQIERQRLSNLVNLYKVLGGGSQPEEY